VTRRLVLASASPARLRLLRAAGIEPIVDVSGVDESAVTAADPWALVQELATAKARVVAARRAADEIVLGCDSMLLLDGASYGKPATVQDAVGRWQRMRGRTASLLTGHCLIDVASGRCESGVADTVVRFGTPSDDEISAYVATGEPLQVAGAFTLDGLSAPFVDGVEGDPSNVIGLSLPLLRELLMRHGVAIMELWTSGP